MADDLARDLALIERARSLIGDLAERGGQLRLPEHDRRRLVLCVPGDAVVREGRAAGGVGGDEAEVLTGLERGVPGYREATLGELDRRRNRLRPRDRAEPLKREG